MPRDPVVTFHEKKILLKVHAPGTWDEALAVLENDLAQETALNLPPMILNSCSQP